MRKIIIILLLILHLGYTLASPIDKETAKKVAINFLNNKTSSSLIVKNVIAEELNNQTSFYVVNFQSGGWVMVSADNSAVPVLGYNLNGEYKLEDEKPEPFLELTTNYKEQIATAKTLKSSNVEFQSKWDNLLTENSLKSLKSYTPGTPLLDVAGRGHVQWSQDENNDGDCPGYSKFCPSNDVDEDDCDDHKPAGCGAVSMGQIMWYWQWPVRSSYRTYNWDLMPSELNNTSLDTEIDEVAHFLRDCGLAVGMNYSDLFGEDFSWTTVNNVEEAFNDEFNYSSAKKHVRTDWEYGSSWGNLLRSEIDNERPVFYRGDKNDVSSSKHFFVLDGYDASDNDYFHFNFGWGYPGNSYNTSYQYLNDITPGSHEYNENQMAIVGISPTYTENVNITDVSYTVVSDMKNEEAQQNIILPATANELSIEEGGGLILTAGNSITLNPGFHANAESNFVAQINPDFTEVTDINVSKWVDGFTPNGDGINDEFCMTVENANSWEFEAFDSDGITVFQSAGTITDNTVCLWDASGAYREAPWETYYCIIRFKNNYGRYLEKVYDVTAIYITSKSAEFIANSLENDDLETDIRSYEENLTFNAYPNPSKGIINFYFSYNTEKNIKIYNDLGSLCYQKNNIKEMFYNIDFSSFSNGLYVIYVEIDNQIFTQKIILEK